MVTLKKSIIAIITVVVLVILFNLCTYVVYEDEVAIVRHFGRISTVIINLEDRDKVNKNLLDSNMKDVAILDSKGLKLKIPFVQSVTKFDGKYLTYSSVEETINTKDRRELDIQMYAQYRIVDPAKFAMVVGSSSEANITMDNRVYPVIIQSANSLEFNEFFQPGLLEEKIVEKLDELNNQLVSEFGLFVTDVGINRKKFPQINVASIESKMSKQIEKESEKLKAEGDSEYQKALALTDRQKKEIIAKAVEESAKIKAAADAESLKIYQESLKKDLDFYRFIQRMDIYKNLKDTTIFMDSNNDILDLLNAY